MALERDTVQRWLDAYVQAWLSYEPDAIGALFSDDAIYAFHPWDKNGAVAHGRAAIVKAWSEPKDPPGTYQAQYEPIAIDGDVAVATGRSSYFTKSGVLKREYYNCFVMQFDSDGRCTQFTEWFMKVPKST
jgi:ketosteroid isomerase-like protein